MSGVMLKERLRADLKAAMQARAADEVRVLRVLIAALDNAEAVPSDEKPYSPRAFGDPSGEVARLDLDGAAVNALLADEVAARLSAAADYRDHGQNDEASRLEAEAAIMGRYRKLAR
jgi:uncharacterized protein YqeY